MPCLVVFYLTLYFVAITLRHERILLPLFCPVVRKMNGITKTSAGYLSLQTGTPRKSASSIGKCNRPESARGSALAAIARFTDSGGAVIAGFLKGAIASCFYGISYAIRLRAGKLPGHAAFLPNPWSYGSRRAWIALPVLLLGIASLGGIQPALASQQSKGQMLVTARVVYHCQVRTSISERGNNDVHVTVSHCPSEPHFRGTSFSTAHSRKLAVMARQYTLKRISQHRVSGVEYLAIEF